MSPATDPVLEVLWKRLLDDWDDESRHSAFLEHCQSHDQLADAATRYRGMAGDRARRAIAEKKLKAVALLAMARLEVVRVDERRDHGRIGSYMLIVVFLGATVGLLAYLGLVR